MTIVRLASAPMPDDLAPVGARPCGCPGAGWGTPSAPRRRDGRDGFRRGVADDLGVARDVRRIDASGVPGPAPGQPQGRAPTLCVWRTARSPAHPSRMTIARLAYPLPALRSSRGKGKVNPKVRRTIGSECVSDLGKVFGVVGGGLPDADAGGHVADAVAVRGIVVEVGHLVRVGVEIVEFALVGGAKV